MANRTDGSSALKENNFKRIGYLNNIRISSTWELKTVLEELEQLEGEIIEGSVLETSVKNYLGPVEMEDISALIEKIEVTEKISPDEAKTSVVDEAKIKELVEEYEKYIEKGLSNKEALDKIYRDNKGEINSKDLEHFLQEESNKYQKKIKETEEKDVVEEKIINLDDYRKRDLENKEEIIREKEEIQEEVVLEDKKETGAKVINLNDYRKRDLKDEEKIIKEEGGELIKEEVVVKEKNVVEEKIENLSKEIRREMGGDDNFEKVIQPEIRAIINEDQIKTSGEEIADLSKVIAEGLKTENNSEIQIEAKKNRIEIENWKEKNIEKVNNFKKEDFKKSFIKETIKLNPDIKTEELNKAGEYSQLVAEIYFSESIIDGQKDKALQVNNRLYSPGKLENAWTDLKGVTNSLAKKPEEIKEIKYRYELIKSNLKSVNLPANFKETRSFENVISSFNDKGVSSLFSKTQGYLGWAGRIDKLTGGWLSKKTTEGGAGIMSKIGNQTVQEFATNALNVMAEQGFKKGISTVLSGILGGGVKAATAVGVEAVGGAAAGAATAAGAAAVSATGVGAIVVAALAVLKVVKDAVGKIAEKLGISFKKGLEENFGKVGGAVISGGMFLVGLPFLLIGAISAAAATPVLLLVFGGLFGYQMLMGNSVSSLVPPEGMGSFEESLIPTRDPSLPVPEGCPSGWPITNGVITQGPNGSYSHKGIEAIDIANDAVPIYATHPGQAHVTSGPSSTGRWNYSIRIIGVCEGKEFSTGYSHLVSDYLKGTTVVEKGDIIGYVDNSGNSTGPHLHYQVNGLGSINNYLPKAIPNGYRSSKSPLVINVP